VPDAFGTRCGATDSHSLGLGAGAGRSSHLTRPFVVRGTAHLNLATAFTGCDLIGRAVPSEPGTYAILGNTTYAAPRERFGTTTLSGGVEAPLGPLLFRAMVGGGAVLGGRVLPLGIGTLGVGTHGAGVRGHLEWEHSVSRVSATADHRVYEAGTGVPLATTRVSFHVRPQWSTLRALVEIPLGQR
jgi:hypothetical protein